MFAVIQIKLTCDKSKARQSFTKIQQKSHLLLCDDICLSVEGSKQERESKRKKT